MTRENRIHPRVPASFQAEILDSAGNRLEVTTVNLSLSGVMIEATQEHFESILVNSKGLNLNKPVEVDLQFKIPKNKSSRIVSSHCRAIYVRRMAQNKYYIGFKFLKITQKCEAVVKAYIDANIR